MARDEAYREAEKKIEAARRSVAKELDFRSAGLTQLPESLGQLAQLEKLNLSQNKLTTLPEWLGQLTQLQKLDLSGNLLTTLPDWIGKFQELEELFLGSEGEGWGNPIAGLPPSVREFRRLRRLQVTGCGLEDLPSWIGELHELTFLLGNGNLLTTFPETLGDITRLEYLIFENNQIRDLPSSLSRLKNLRILGLGKNPLNPELDAAYKEGLDAVKRYLHEMAKGAKKRYEAKLLILGDGNEGKTCVSRALRNLPFREQKTTRGVDVVQWEFAHPDHSTDREKDITLNIWDFEGQEISHQTHQFFLTSQSLYLLVFKCRDQFLLDRAEYWLDTIRARAPKAKVAIVISQCEGRMPLVPLDRIQAQYSDLLAKEWLFPVGCEDGSNITKLKTFLQRWAAELEFMGFPWPVSYRKAETELKAKAKRSTARITRDKLYAAFHRVGVSKDGYEDAAAAMARLGVVTQFPDCPDLRDFVVLRPQWLTKAISRVMEDKQLSADHGEIALQRMEGPLCSEALCEFVPEERKLCIEVRAAYPQNMCEQIHAYVKAVFSFFNGLDAERSYGCIKVNSATGTEERCNGVHTEKRIYTAISKQRPTFDCEFEDHA